MKKGNKIYRKISNILFIVCLIIGFKVSSSKAQSGPGGFGDTSGTSNLVLWLRADTGVLNGSSVPAANGESIMTWNDQSGYGYDAVTGPTSPIFDAVNAGFRDLPTITFAGGGTEFLFIEDDANEAPQLDNTSELSILYVYRPDNATGVRAHVSKRDGNGVAQSYVFFENNSQNGRINANNDAGQNIAANTTYINSTTYQNGDFNHFLNQLSGGGITGGTATIPNNDSDFNIGAFQNGDSRTFDGNLAEIIVFRSFLTNAERIVVETYLASKYNITVPNDFWDETTFSAHDNEIAGVGQHTDGSVAQSATSSVLTISDGDTRASGDWLFWGHDTGDITTYTTSEIVTGSSQQRLAREWRVNETNDLGNVNVSIDFDNLPPTGVVNPIFRLLVDSDGDFSDAEEFIMTNTGSGSTVAVDLNDGDYLAIAFEEGGETEIWYSFLSGDWSDPNNWTLDGAISALFVNPDLQIPNPGDSVVIQSGRTITADINNIVVQRIEIIGTLDLGSTTDHFFGNIEGSGTMRLSGAGGLDNYPSGADTGFFDPLGGGTVEYYGTGLEINGNRSYNNLLVNLTNTTDLATLTASEINIFGNFTVNNGGFQFNDLTSTNNLEVNIFGDFFVNGNGSVDVSTANARHELNLHSDFINQGDVDFTNRTSQITGSEATDGIVDVNFVSATKNQTVLLQNTTDFYRIEVNKGVDDTFIVDISADDPSFFNLYGFANSSTNSAQSTVNSNALGLIFGTIRVGNNVTISPLNAGGNYSIFEGSRIWVNGGVVEKTGGTAIVPYGRIRVSAGELNAPINSGITTRESGQVTLEGGTITVNQFRTSVNGLSAQGGLIMSGGIFNVTGVNTSESFYIFSLTNTGNVFSMSGGTINLSGTNARGGIFINSSDENISVTGGTVNFNITNNNDLRVTSRAPFFNVNVLRTSGTGVVEISDGSSGTGAGTITLVPEGLTVLNDFRVDNTAGNATAFDANNFDLNITGSLIVDNGSTLDLTGMETTFEGVGGSTIDIQTGATLSIDSLIINKSTETSTVTIGNGAATALIINNLLSVASGNLNPVGFDITVNGTLNVADTIGSTMSTGQLFLNAGISQLITSTNGVVCDLEIENINGVSLDGDLSILDNFTLDAGVFDINTSKLTLNNPISTAGVFSSTLMVQTGGNPTDGGIEFLFDEDETITYPFGIVGNYTPLVADIDTTNNDSGYIRVNPVNIKLGTLNDDAAVTDFLNYYWRIGNRDFSDLPRVNSYVFTYIDNVANDDVVGNEADLQPGYVEDGEDGNSDNNLFSRVPVGSSADVNTTTNEITFVFPVGEDTLQSANYTAGEIAAFSGAVTVFYSRKQAGTDQLNWVSPISWSTDGVNQHAGAAATTYPGQNSTSDVVIMGFGGINAAENFNTCDPCTIVNTVRHDHRIRNGESVTVAEIIFDQNPAANALNNIDTRIRVFNTGTLNADRVTGRGTMFQLANTNGSIGTINADFNEFNQDPDNGWFLLVNGGGTSVTISDRFEFPTLRVFGARSDSQVDRAVSYTQDVTSRGLVVDRNAELHIDQNFTVNGTARIGLNLGGELIFGRIGGGAVGSNVTFECDSLILTSSNNSGILVNDAGSDTHILKVNGSINLDQGVAFDLHNATTSNAILEVSGTGEHLFENTADITVELSRLLINKGADTTNFFTVNTDFNLNGDNSGVPQALELQNGKLILNNSSINIELTDGAEFIVQSSAGLEVTQGTATANNGVIILDGLLRVNGGTVDLGTTDIEYSNTGSALLSINSGTLEVGGQVRRALTSTSGILKYRQTGGDVDIAVDGADVTDRGVFEILNPGSEFILTGGTFNIQRGVLGDNNVSLRLDPETSELSGSTINVFENLGANYGANFFNMQVSIPLNNVTINNTIDLPDARAFVENLTVNDLTINTNQGFQGNGLDIRINGDLVNEGQYLNDSGNTILGGSADQSLSGTGIFNIFDLTKLGSGTATTLVDLTLGNDLRVTEGILNMGSNTISLENDAFIESVLTNTSGDGLIFNGTASQNLFGLSNNTVTLGTITINNPNGVDIPDGNGFNFDITQELRLDGGVFNIGGSLVTMRNGSTVTEVSPFSVNNMVQTNSSFTDNGFVIEFFDIAADTVIFFPVGELSFTPVQFNIGAGATAGDIRVRPANERHPAIVENVEPMGETEIDDLQNSLQYHWVVVARNTTGVQGSATFFYNDEDILAIESDTSNFISARLLSNNSTWDKFPPTFFQGASETFSVPLNVGAGVTFAEITGDYTAGLGSTDGINNDIEGAIPDQLAQFISNFSGAGNYSDDANWIPVAPTPALTSGIGPIGAQITISAGDTVTLDLSNIRLFSTTIEAGGTLFVPSGAVNERLGTVSGTGTIIVNDTELLPTGEYSSFLACDGGAIQYSGTTDFSVLSGISQIRKVILEGSGVRVMPNNILNVCDTLLINGPTVDFSSGQTFTVGDSDTDRLEIESGVVTLSNGSSLVIDGDLIISNGSFTGSSGSLVNITDDLNYSGGALDWNGTNVALSGDTEQMIDGNFTGVSAFGNLLINNTDATGVTINSGDVEVEGILTLTDGLVNTTTTESLTLTSTGDWEGASNSSYVTGPISKNDITVASTFEFPVGKAVRYAPASIVNIGTGGQDWSAEYFTSTNPTFPNTSFDDTDPGSGFNALDEIIASDRWEIISSGSNNAQIELFYGTHLTIGDVGELRVVWWNTAESRWENQGGILDGNATTGMVTSENSIGFTTQQFALGLASEITLPVEFLYFDGDLIEGESHLEWATASELDNDRFEVERSLDGITFERIGIVGGNGTTNEVSTYQFVDKLPGVGLNFYRLKQIDFDEQFEYSETILVDNRDASVTFDMNVYPNPTDQGNININLITGDETSPVLISIYDLNGRAYFNKQISPEELIRNEYQLSLPQQISRGAYLIRIQQRDDVKLRRLMIR